MNNSGVSRSCPRRGSLFLRAAAYSALVTIRTLMAFGFRFILHEKTMLFAHLSERAGTLALALDSMSGQELKDQDFSKAAALAWRIVKADEQILYVVITPPQGPSWIQTDAENTQRELDDTWRPSLTEKVEEVRRNTIIEGKSIAMRDR